jgi:hypothetical protein
MRAMCSAMVPGTAWRVRRQKRTGMCAMETWVWIVVAVAVAAVAVVAWVLVRGARTRRLQQGFGPE